MLTELKVEKEIFIPGLNFAKICGEASYSKAGSMYLKTATDSVIIPGVLIHYILSGGSFSAYVKDTGSILSLISEEAGKVLEAEIIEMYKRVHSLIKAESSYENSN